MIARAWLLAGCVLLSAVSPAWAQRPAEVANLSLPESVLQIDGFRLAVQTEGLDQQPGYLPLAIVATAATGTFPADRTISVTLDPVLLGGEQLGVEPTGVQVDLLLRQGQPQASRELYIPRWSLHGGYRVRVAEGGVPLPGYAGQLGGNIRTDLQGSQMATGRMGVVLAREVQDPQQAWQACPDLRLMRATEQPWMLAAVDLSEPAGTPRQRIAALRTGEAAVQRVFFEDLLPDHWLAYDSLDIVLAPLPLLERVAQQRPDQWRALRQWAAAGGNLWVYAAEDRQRVARLLATSTPATASNDPGFVNLVRSFDWAGKLVELRSAADRSAGGPADPFAGFLTPSRSMGARTLLDLNLDQLQPSTPLSATRMANEMWAQPYLAGQVIAFADPQPFPGDLQQWHVARGLMQHRASAIVRRGLEIAGGSSRFWNWVLPDVARPPVYRFLALLAVFAIMVGPVAYRRTTRAGRPYLMFLIAPVLAVLTTVTMFGYGLIADGLGSQARIRQITWVDGGNGHAARSTRGTYFAALRTPGGLVFPADAAVSPYPQYVGYSRRRGRPDQQMASAGRWVTMTPEAQHLSPSFLPSRVQRQFLSLQPIDAVGRIELLPAEANSDQTSVRNTTPVQIDELVARDADGQYWAAGPLPAGGTATARRIEMTDAARQLRALYNLQRPEPPLGIDTTNRRLFPGSDWVSVVLRDNQWDAAMLDGVFEERLRTLTQLDAQLPGGTFVATAQLTDDALAVPDAEVSDSIHYVLGSLP